MSENISLSLKDSTDLIYTELVGVKVISTTIKMYDFV